MGELVSIIVPIFNVEKYIERCIQSILAQTYANIEVLLINDGSTDDSGQICKKYAELDERIKLFFQENQGVSSARNKGLDTAAGKYIMFVDGDDFVSSSIVQDLLTPLEGNNNLIMSAGRGKVVYTQEENCFDKIESSNERVTHIEMIKRQFLAFPYAQGACVKLFRADKIGSLRFEEGISYNEDSYFTYKYCAKNEGEVYILQKRLYAYYMRMNSTTHELFKREKLSILEFSRKKYQECKDILELRDAARFGVINAILLIIKDVIRSKLYRDELTLITSLRREALAFSGPCSPIKSRKRKIEMTFLKAGLWAYYFLIKMADLLKKRK